MVKFNAQSIHKKFKRRLWRGKEKERHRQRETDRQTERDRERERERDKILPKAKKAGYNKPNF